jgi:hypothetical protein
MESYRVQLHKHVVYHVEIEADSLEEAMDEAERDPEEYIDNGEASAMSEWVDVEDPD